MKAVVQYSHAEVGQTADLVIDPAISISAGNCRPIPPTKIITLLNTFLEQASPVKTL